MVLRINPSKALLWRSTSEIQFGSSLDAVKIANITAGQERLLALLSRGIADDFFDQVAVAVGAEDATELLQNLDGVLLRDASPATTLSAEFIEHRFAEICRAQAVHSRDGSSVLAGRQLRRVFVQPRTAAHQLVSDSLEQSGIGFLLDDQPEELPPNVDFAVLLANNAIAPSDYARWMVKGVAHISVVFDSEGVSVSPVIESGKTPCLSCFHENQTSSDSAWPAIASQLLFSRQEFDDKVASLFAASIVCQRVLQFCDQLAEFDFGDANQTGYRLSTHSGQISEFKWQFNASCACRVD